MPVLELTDRACRQKAKPGQQIELVDTLAKGLVLRISGGRDVRAWRAHYRFNGKRGWLPLGHFPEVKLQEAREAMLAVRRKLAAGIDPAAREPERHDTVADLIDTYCARHADAKRTGPKIRRRLTKNIGAVIGTTRLADLHRRDVTRCLDVIMKRGKATEAVRVFQDVRAMVRWAAQRGDLDSNILADMKAPAENRQRDRWLTVDEIKTVWAALPTAPMSASVRNCLRLALATGQRIGEISGMAKEELDLLGRRWTIPGARTKNGREHIVPLSLFALRLIGQQWDQESDHVFPGRRGQPHLLSGGISHAVNKAGDGTTLGVPHFVAHDLRRTAATHLEMLGVAPFIISTILNHISETKAGVTGRYRQYDYSSEKREALDLWAAQLQKIIEGQTSL